MGYRMRLYTLLIRHRPAAPQTLHTGAPGGRYLESGPVRRTAANPPLTWPIPGAGLRMLEVKYECYMAGVYLELIPESHYTNY